MMCLGASLEHSSAAADESPGTPPGTVYSRQIQPLLERYCYSCHGNGRRKGDLALDTFSDEAAMRADLRTWQNVLHHVRTGEMPPRNKPQPTLEERDRMVAWIEADVFQTDCNHPDPGRVTIRRLNRVEYNNTIRALTGITFEAGVDFPADDIGYGFDNIGDVLSLPPILLEKYMAAAEKVLSAVLNTNLPPSYPIARLVPDELEATAPGGSYGRGARLLSREGEMSAAVPFSSFGEYAIRIRAFGQQAGPEPVRMDLRLDGELVSVVDVTAVESAPRTYECRLILEPGRKCLTVGYINNYVNPNDPDPNNRDRNLIVESLEIAGPILPEQMRYTDSYRQVVRCRPDEGVAPRQCAERILERFATQAFRRPVLTSEKDRLCRLFDLANDEGLGFEESLRVPLTAILVSPHFLFRGELQTDPNDPGQIRPVDEFALATRLSYFLWSTMPDQALFTEAEQGTLRQNLSVQVNRMLRDSKIRALVDNFALQWLQVRSLRAVAPDWLEFPEFDDELRAAMENETALFCDAIVTEDRSVLEFLDADYTFLNERLAQHYRIDGVVGPEFRRVFLRGTARGGILTQGSILTITSNPTRTSPVKRGKWVLENILGAPPPPPPPNVPELKSAKELRGTLRQRMEQHRENALCASCHARMDPIGFGFENFNAVGGWRAQDGVDPVDPSGELSSGEKFQGPAELKRILVSAKRQDFLRCLTEKLLTYALGRGLEYFDKCAVDQIVERVAAQNYRFSSLVSEIIQSAPFQLRRGEKTPDSAAQPAREKVDT